MREEKEAGLPDHLRCKRTDGRQWRCSRPVMEGKKLCEVHHMQGRHRQNRQKVPESLKIQRKYHKIFKVKQNAEIRARKLTEKSKKLKRKKKKKKRVIGESEALDEAVKKMKLKRGDLRLELIRTVLKKQIEKRKEQRDFEDEDEENRYSSNSDVDRELTRELPNGLMAISSTCSTSDCDNAGTTCDVKIGAEPVPVNRRRFRSKNIEPAPVGTLQVLPYKRDVANLRKRCHRCRKRGQNLIKCSSCRKLFFCNVCVKERYFETQENIEKACPVCRGTCGCNVCSSRPRREIDYEDFLRGRNEVCKVLHFHYLICMLLPVLKQINQDQSTELEIEAKRNGQEPSELKIKQVEFDSNRQHCCDNCKTAIVDFHRSCANCSYTLCLSCCRDILQGRLSLSKGALVCKCPSGSKACTSVMTPEVDKYKSRYMQSYGSNSCNASNASVGISCPPVKFGRCGNGCNLDLRCVFPLNWTKELENGAEEIIGCYELPETADAFSCCSLCVGVAHEPNGIKGLKEAAERENSNDNFLYHPTIGDIHSDTFEHFQKHWVKGHPVIVRNVLQGASELSWDPIVMFCNYLKNSSKSEDNDGMAKNPDCLDWFEVEIGIKQLLLGSLTGRKRVNMCDEKLRLKGWLSSRILQEQFPAHYSKIIHGLPLPEYMDPKSGLLNIASKLPQNTPKPDLGPCVYISYGCGEELKQTESVTKLCYDLCDVVNILAHTTDVPVSTRQLNVIRELMKRHKCKDQTESCEAAPEEMENETKGISSLDGNDMQECVPCDTFALNLRDRNMYHEGESDTDSDPMILHSGTTRSSKSSGKRKFFRDHLDKSHSVKERTAETCGAQWDVFRRQDVPKLMDYLRRHSDEFSYANGYRKHVVHPILDQDFFLDSFHKMRLKEEFEVEPWSFEQHVGEAVIIPAGCPYQIRNLKSCVNVVVDFVSPENVAECIHLINGLRLLPDDHTAKANKLEVKKMALYGIGTALKEIRELTCAD